MILVGVASILPPVTALELMPSPLLPQLPSCSVTLLYHDLPCQLTPGAIRTTIVVAMAEK